MFTVRYPALAVPRHAARTAYQTQQNMPLWNMVVEDGLVVAVTVELGRTRSGDECRDANNRGTTGAEAQRAPKWDSGRDRGCRGLEAVAKQRQQP